MANFAEAIESKAQMRKQKPASHALSSIELREGENGGHVIEHRFDNSGPGTYKQPDVYPFSKHAGAKPQLPKGHVLAHVAKTLNIPHEIMAEDRGIGEDGE